MTHAVFNRWDVVADGWYPLCRSDELPRGGVRGVDVAAQHLVVWRGEDGVARVIDGFCPHMGTDLAIGRVDGPHLRCFFHQWAFDGGGRCVDVPAAPGTQASTPSWAVAERYGLVWAWPAAEAASPLPDFPGLGDAPVAWRHGRLIERSCHHHVCMINGIDVQHLATVHGLHMAMDVAIDGDAHTLDITLTGPPSQRTLVGRALHASLGGHYRYSMRYHHATVGLLTTVQDCKLFGRVDLPPLRMLFAYRPLPDRRTAIYPVFITPQGFGATARLEAMRVGFHMLRDEDGQIYDNIRFSTGRMLAVDAPVLRFVQWTNSLPASGWAANP